MSLSSFQWTPPLNYQGIEDYAPEELQSFALELQRRLIQNQDSINSAITSQVVVDTGVVPATTSGESNPTTGTLVTDLDIEASEMETILWMG